MDETVSAAPSGAIAPVYTIDGPLAVTGANAAGPWDPTMQHGSAPAALVTWAAERISTASPMRVARVAIDLMRPVPLAPLTVRTRVVRDGRKIQLCAVSLLAGETEVVQGTVLKIRHEAQHLPADVTDPAIALPLPDESEVIEPNFSRSPFVRLIGMRSAHGSFGVPGPAAIWYRVEAPLIAGEAVSQAMRAVVASDFSNGTSAALDFRKWKFLNADLTVSLAREPVGEWILLDAESWIGRDGAGIAASRLADIRGYFGRAVQSLVIERR